MAGDTGSAVGGSRRALIVRGGWDGHQPVATTELFLEFLRAHGFAVDIHELDIDLGPVPYADAAYLAGIDLILQCVSMGTITDGQVRGLRAAVAAGTGLAGWHGGMVDAFRHSYEYHQLVGGLFVAHPADAAGHAEKAHRYAVVDHDHEITAGLDDFDLVTEQYWVLADDCSDVLVTTTQQADADHPWSRPVTSPAVWIRRWGAGRVFVATPGHAPAVLAEPSVRTLVERGLVWAARTPGRAPLSPGTA